MTLQFRPQRAKLAPFAVLALVVGALLASSAPALATVELVPWAGDIAFLSTQSSAGSFTDSHSVSPPGFGQWDDTEFSAAQDPQNGISANAYFELATIFTDSLFTIGSSGIGVSIHGGFSSAGCFVFLQFVVHQTQDYFAQSNFTAGDFTSQKGMVFISSLQDTNHTLIPLALGPGSTTFSGRLSPGFYCIFFRNSFGAEAWTGAANTVDTQVHFSDVANPLIQQQPQDQTVATGSSASFSVAASGVMTSAGASAGAAATAALSYQWRHNFQNLVNDGRIQGATTNLLHFTTVTMADSGLYDCVVTSGAIVEPSSIVRLTVSSGTTAVNTVSSNFALSLGAPAPSPFASRTLVRFSLPAESDVALDIVDVSGRHVKALVAGDRRAAGDYSIEWNGESDLGARAPAGIYFMVLRAGSELRTRRVVRLAP